MSVKTRASSSGGHDHYVHDLWSESSSIITSSSTWGNGRDVHYNPLQVPFTLTVNGVGLYNSTPNIGNRYVALYDSALLAPVNILAVSALTATTGIRQKQVVAFTAPLQILPGLYFVVATNDTSTDAFGINSSFHQGTRLAPANINHGLPFYYQTPGAFAVPPAVATPILNDGSAKAFYIMWADIASVP